MRLAASNHKDTKRTKDTKEGTDALSSRIIAAAIEVHRVLGPGLLESIYEEALCRELEQQGIPLQRQACVPMEYKGLVLATALRLDVLVDEAIIVEVKAVEHLDPVHSAQLLSYLRAANLWLGLLINFNVPLLKNGIKRLVSGDPPSL